MSKPSKPAPADGVKADDLPFEEALKKLEAIVEEMESDELPLETLLSRYEQGNRLAKVCQAKLAEAEVRIQKLETDADGVPQAKPFHLNDEE